MAFPKQSSSRNSTVQVISLTTTSTGATNAFGAQTYQIRVATTANAFYAVGDGTQTASASAGSSFLPNTCIEYVQVNPGQKIAGIVTSGTGTMTITELT